jgi:hypothetical protein
VAEAVGIGAADLAALVPDDSTAILEYVTGSFGASTTLFLVTRGPPERRLQALRLPPADSLEPVIARFEALVQNGAEADAVGRSLGEVLLGSAVARLGSPIRRLIIVPDGPLHRLPFDALRLPDGQ